MAIFLIDKIEPKNAAFTGIVDAEQVLGNGTTNVLPDNTVAESNVTQHEAALSLTSSQITDLNTEISNNTDVAANTAARHDALTIGTANGLSLAGQALSLGTASGSTTGALSSTDWTTFNNKQAAISVADTAEIDLTFSGNQITASLVASSIDETKLDASVNASLDLADSALQSSDIGSSIQAYNADLTGIAALTISANDLIVGDGANTFSTTTITTFGKSLIGDANAATARTTLGLEIGTDVQAQSSVLQDLADNLTAAAAELNLLDGTLGTTDQIIYADGTKLTSSALLTTDGSRLAAGTTLAANVGINGRISSTDLGALQRGMVVTSAVTITTNSTFNNFGATTFADSAPAVGVTHTTTNAGYFGGARNIGAGTVTNLTAVRGDAQQTSGGTVGTAEGVRGLYVPGNNSTATTAIALRGTISSGTGSTITSAYGVYVDAMPAIATNKFGAYILGSDSVNYFQGSIGMNTTAPTELLDVNGDAIRIRTAQTPASAAATGSTGMVAWDSNYIYVCTATNTWKRVAIATW